MKRSSYIATTIINGAFGVFGLAWAVFAAVIGRYFISVLGLIFSYVAFDNFFCGAHARSCGYRAKGHYVIPPFLKKVRIIGENDKGDDK